MLSEYGAHVQPRHLRKTRVLVLVCLLAVVMAVVWEGMALYRQTVQRRLDREFDRALAQNPRRLVELVRQGASVTSPPERGRAALFSANLTDEVDVFLQHGARLHSLGDEAWLPSAGSRDDMVSCPPDLLQLLEGVPEAHRTSAYWETLGEVRYVVGQYADAAAAFQKSARGNPADHDAQAGLLLARDAVHAVTEIRKAAPHTPHLIQVRPTLGGLVRRWVALTGLTEDPYSSPLHVRRLRVSLWEEGADWRRLWQSTSLYDPRVGDDECNAAQLYQVDLNADGAFEYILLQRFFAASSTPTQALVFRPRGNRLEQVLTVSADDDLLITPDDAPGRYTIMGDHPIGMELSHAGQPRWSSYYAWRGNRWKLANADFPSRFDDLDREIRAALVDYPRDPELLIGAARIATYRKHPDEARATYHTALKALNQKQAETSDTWTRTRLPELKRVIAAELRSLPVSRELH